MPKVFSFPTNLKHFILSSMNKKDLKIQEIICIVKYSNGDSEFLPIETSFEFKCLASKLLDFSINQDIKND